MFSKVKDRGQIECTWTDFQIRSTREAKLACTGIRRVSYCTSEDSESNCITKFMSSSLSIFRMHLGKEVERETKSQTVKTLSRRFQSLRQSLSSSMSSLSPAIYCLVEGWVKHVHQRWVIDDILGQHWHARPDSLSG